MASGSFKSYIRTNKEYIQVNWSSKPIEGENKSKVTVYTRMYRPYSISSSANKSVVTTINGTKHTTTVKGWGGKGWTSSFAKTTQTISHDSDGKKTIKISVKVEVGLTLTSVFYNSVSASSECKLDNLSTKSTITITSDTTLNIGQTLKLSLSRSSSTVRHKIVGKIGDSSFTILKKADDDGSAKTYSQLLSSSTFLPMMTSKSAKMTITCTTYKSASSSTVLGTSTKTATIKLRDSDRPALTAGNITLASVPVTPNTYSDIFIQKYSYAKFTFAPTLTAGTAGAVKQYSVTVDGKTYTYSPSDNIVTNILTGSGTLSATIYVTDKRGMKSEPTVMNFTVCPYTSPVIKDFSAVRCDADGTENKQGESVKIKATFNCFNFASTQTPFDIQVSSRNILESDFSIIDTIIDTQNLTFEKIYGTYSVENSFEFQIKITDTFSNTASYSTDIGTKKLLVDLAPNGVAVGKVSERGTYEKEIFEVGWDSYFDGDIFIGGKSLKELLGIE